MIYKLSYDNREEGLADLQEKGVFESNLTQAVVEVGILVDVEGTFDEDGNELTETTYLSGFHFDVMTDMIIDFGLNKIKNINNKRHKFAN